MTHDDRTTPGAAVADDDGAGRSAGAAVAVLDDEGTVIGWTGAAQSLTGFTAQDVVGRGAVEMLVPAQAGRRAAAQARRCRTENGWSGVAGVRRRDRDPVDLTLCVRPLARADGKRQWLVCAAPAGARPSPVGGLDVESLLSGAPIGICLRDAQLRCIWANDALAVHDGISREQRLGRRVSEVLPGEQGERVEAAQRQVLAHGVPVVDHEFRRSDPGHPHRERTYSNSFFRLDDGEGRPSGVCTMSLDVTDRERARERLAVLTESSTRIGSTLDVMRTGQELADFVVPSLADYVTVDLAEEIRLGEELPVPFGAAGGSTPAFRRAGLASVHDGAPESLWARGENVFVRESSPFSAVLTTGTPYLEPVLDTSPGGWLAQDAKRAEKVRRHGMHSLMVVPIHARGAVLGVAVFVRSADPTPFEADDLLFAQELVSRAALALDNARQYVRERATALALQRDLLPHRLQGGAAVDVACRYLPADREDGVGGDWYDVVPLSAARVALVVGDVVGHGIHAAAAMGRLRTAVHTLATMDLPPDELLTRLDETISRLSDEDLEANALTGSVLGATCLYAVYDPVNRSCTMATAGHPPPVIVSPDGDVTIPRLPTGLPLGVGMASYEAVQLELPEGSVLALYTDGLVEERGADIEEGMRRLGDAVAQPGCSVDALCASVFDTVPAPAPSDDATLLLARTHALDPGEVATWSLARDPAVVGQARALTQSLLAGWGLEHLAPTTELIVSELVTNAVRHGAGPITLRLIRHRVLACEVFDASDSIPRLRHARATDEGGRGLFLVARLSRRHGTRTTAEGKVVWAEQELTPAQA
ncbi:SpoIIE family protein phosphatase [Streptomyces sp. WAC00469]|uniref:SpoIIE family protein phosphatase n=1 Tax=Streptomyces sp. WAC00469 TaxID=2487415 RepID=UPI000F741121|nr:SpoIIE family protein phosphatase [Streptomyces sp. WAC00469]RSS06876.1 PAS domain-containing protein [Streptomyces sp. WAC00469]